jgi:hypothetical protein
MEIKKLKKYWVVVNSKGEVMHWTIAQMKSSSIEYFLEDCTGTWQMYRKKYGYKCVKVDISFEAKAVA